MSLVNLGSPCRLAAIDAPSPLGDAAADVLRLRAALHEAEERWMDILGASRSLVLEAEPTRNLVRWSGPSESLGRSLPSSWSEFRAMLHEDGRRRLDEARVQAGRDGRTAPLALRVPARPGQPTFGLGGAWRPHPPGPPRFVALVRLTGVPDGSTPSDEGVKVTGAQVRAARGALGWSVRELSEQARVSVATINRFESAARAGTPRHRSVAALQRVLARRGIRFFESDGAPAIAMAEPTSVARHSPTAMQPLRSTSL